MPNPRYIGRGGEPTVELLGKLARGKAVYLDNLDIFCSKHFYDPRDFRNVTGVYLIGSHATDGEWMDDTSDVDFKLLVPDAIPAQIFQYKRDILNPLLCPPSQEKRRWIDLYFVREDYQVTPPRFDLTSYWDVV